MKYKSLIIGLVIAIAAIYFTVRNVSLQELLESLKHVRYIYILPSIVILILSYVARVYRWRELILPIKNIRAKELYSPLMIGFMGNLLPARAGEFLRAYLVGKKHDIPVTGAFATVVVERMFDMILLLLLFAWILIFNADVFNSGASISGMSLNDLAYKFGLGSGVLLVMVSVFIYLMLAHPQKMMKLIHWFLTPFPSTWKEKVEHLVETFSEGLHIVKDFKALLRISFYSLLVWFTMLASFYPFYWAFGLQDKSLQSLVLLVVMVCILIAILPTPGFLGSFQAGVMIALHQIMNEAEVIAVSFGMIAWVVNFGVLFAAGIYFILHDHLSVRQLVKVEEGGHAAEELH